MRSILNTRARRWIGASALAIIAGIGGGTAFVAATAPSSAQSAKIVPAAQITAPAVANVPNFADLVEAESDDAEAIHWLLRAGTSLQRWRTLAPLLVRYLGRRPEDASVRFALAGVRLREGRLDLARVEHDRLRREAPDLDGLDELAEALAEPTPRAKAAASGA